jgi:phosphoglycolate phosphatase-like HAD superfamily hydrolase
MLGPAPVADFDGTLARLEVPWGDVKAALGLEHIEDLWRRADQSGWNVIGDLEVEAARTADPVQSVERALATATAFAILTNNSERAVHVFLQRFPALGARVVAVVGRETLRGPKTAPDVFERGFQQCITATSEARGTEPVIYVGDRDYELDFARRLGADVRDVASLESELR